MPDRFSAYDALIYATYLLQWYGHMSVVSPCGTLVLELLNLEEEQGGMHLAVDYIGANESRRNVFSAHWTDTAPDFVKFNSTDTNWHVKLEDWYDRIRAAATVVEVAGVLSPESDSVASALSDRSES